MIIKKMPLRFLVKVATQDHSDYYVELSVLSVHLHPSPKVIVMNFERE